MLSTTSATHDEHRPKRSHALRWLAVFVAVTVLHWFAAQWIERVGSRMPPAAPVHVPVQVALLKPARIEQSAAPAAAPAHTAPAPVHKSEPHRLSAISAEPHPKATEQPHSEAPAAASTAATDDAASAPATTANAAAASANGAGKSPTQGNAAQPSHGLKFSVPPSGELQYDTFYNGVRNQPGTIHWKSDGQHYEMIVTVPLPFIGTFSWTSHGHIDAFGLAPDQYIEHRGHRPEDFTIFNRADKLIAFTRTPKSLPLEDGAQDRFSMVMQLASLVRGDPGAYKPGVTREFYVADNDSGEIWPITTIGDETVRTDHGFVTARHFMRLPRHDGDRRRIDVWLAPSLGWLPVRLVQTEPNGTEVELLWRGALDAPLAAPRDAAPVPVPQAQPLAGDTPPTPNEASEPSASSPVAPQPLENDATPAMPASTP